MRNQLLTLLLTFKLKLSHQVRDEETQVTRLVTEGRPCPKMRPTTKDTQTVRNEETQAIRLVAEGGTRSKKTTPGIEGTQAIRLVAEGRPHPKMPVAR